MCACVFLCPIKQLQENGNEPDGDSEISAHQDDATENENVKKINDNDIEHEADGDDEDEDKDDVSPSPAMQIEIMVRGEPDNGGVQSEGGNFPQSDETSDDVWFSIHIYR